MRSRSHLLLCRSSWRHAPKAWSASRRHHRGKPHEQGHLPISDGLLGQIVKNDQGVHAVVTEKLAHGTSGVGSQVLKGSGIGSGGRDNDTVFHGIGISKTLDDLSNSGSLLTDSNVNAEQFLLVF